MRIHIVQKGDTLWNIAKKYGVDFEQLKSMNTQLSNPDMIMPGMKIKVPQGTKQVKKEAPKQKAQAPKKEMPSQPPYKDTSPKPIPKIKEDEKKPAAKGVMEKPMKPMQPISMNMPITMPSIDQQMQNYYTTFHLPQMPMPQPKEESPKAFEPKDSPKEELKGEKMEDVKGVQSPAAGPMPQQPYQQPMQPQQPQYQPMHPQLVHTDYYCCPPYPVMMPMQMPMHHHPMQQQPMPMMGDESSDDMVQGVQAGGDCGCDEEKQGPQGYGPMMGPWGHPPHGYHPWQQAPYGGMQQPMGYGPPQHPQMGWNQPQQGWGQPNPQQMGQWDPQQMNQGYQQPWRDDDIDES